MQGMNNINNSNKYIKYAVVKNIIYPRTEWAQICVA